MIKEIIILLFAIPLGIFGAYKTNWERDIYLDYFRYLIPILDILTLILYFVDKKTSLTLAFMAIMMVSWKYSTKWFKKRR